MERRLAGIGGDVDVDMAIKKHLHRLVLLFLCGVFIIENSQTPAKTCSKNQRGNVILLLDGRISALLKQQADRSGVAVSCGAHQRRCAFAEISIAGSMRSLQRWRSQLRIRLCTMLEELLD